MPVIVMRETVKKRGGLCLAVKLGEDERDKNKRFNAAGNSNCQFHLLKSGVKLYNTIVADYYMHIVKPTLPNH
jgi:hypothetical protein